MLLGISFNLSSQVKDSLKIVNEEDHPYFLKQLMNRNIKSDSLRMKVETLNSLRKEYVILIYKYQRAQELKDTVSMENIMLKRKLINDSSYGIIGLPVDSLKSFRKTFELVEKTINHYRESSREDLINSNNTLILELEPCLFIYLEEFYSRCYYLEQRLAELELNVKKAPNEK
jgi:hypothetical protein